MSLVSSASFPPSSSFGHAVVSNTKPSFNQCHATVYEQIVLETCRELEFCTCDGIPPQIKTKHRILGVGRRITILFTNLESGPSFSHSSFSKSFYQIIILKLCSYLARRYILYRRIDGLRVHFFFSPHGNACSCADLRKTMA